MRFVLVFLAGFLSIFTLGGCKFNVSDSNVKVVNGRKTTAGEFPAVVQLRTDMGGGRSAMCTATWVSDQTIMTAAHCIDEAIGGGASRVSVKDGTGTGAVATGLHVYPNWNRDHDVAVLVFKPGSSSSWMSIAGRQAKVGDQMAIVGYGKNDHLDNSSGGVRRTGTNTVIEVNSSGRISFDGYVSPKNNDGSKVTNSQGDSGGPLIIDSKLFGVSSTVSPNYPRRGVNRGNYESMRAPKVFSWLSGLSKKGVKIVGLTPGASQNSTPDNKMPPPNKGDRNGPDLGDKPNDQAKPKPPPSRNTPKDIDPPKNNKLVDCNADFSSVILGGGSGVCKNSSSGFCYRYANRSVQYVNGRVSCDLAENKKDASPITDKEDGLVEPEQDEPLKCNQDFMKIARSTSPGICKNLSSGFCYRYDRGSILYSSGRVQCP